VNSSEKFHQFILNTAGGRLRVEQELLWRALQAVHPEQTVTIAARGILRDLLDQLFLSGFAEPPKGREGWDESALPIVPRWIRLCRSSVDRKGQNLKTIPWAPELRFLTTIRTSVPPEDLLKLQRFFAVDGRTLPIVPIKERSAQIFDDEKRLDSLYANTNLFHPGHLTLKQLRCFCVAEPLGWKRGCSPEAPLIIVENVATWHSYCRWDEAAPQFSAVVYGAGNRFIDGVVFIQDIYREIGGVRPIRYFGDLDANGLNIPLSANKRAAEIGLPDIEPHRESYRWLLELSDATVAETGADLLEKSACEWLQDLAEGAWAILSANRRIAQERIGWHFLQSKAAPVNE
jgi:hypothetical protein